MLVLPFVAFGLILAVGKRLKYRRGETGQQLLLGANSALAEQIHRGRVKMHARTELLDVVVADGRARGVVVRDLVTGEIRSHAADAVVAAS
jgi:succinate dehydrogenase / fumarate reductase flavoprotein subunit